MNFILKSIEDSSTLEIASNYGSSYKDAKNSSLDENVVYVGIEDGYGDVCTSLTIEQTKQLIKELTRIVKIFDEDYSDNIVSELKVKIELEGAEDVSRTIDELEKKLHRLRVAVY